MQLRRDERDPVKQLLDHGLLVPRVLLSNLGLLDLSLLIDGGLDGLCVAGVLYMDCEPVCMRTRTRVERRTDASNALNSSSLNFLYSSISFVACVRASLSFFTLSARRCGSDDVIGPSMAHTLARLLDDLRGLFLCLKQGLDVLRLLCGLSFGRLVSICVHFPRTLAAARTRVSVPK